ncbi:formylglycine-generating enzyme family protein [bacterium]|nr:formylglycine-generating enzyme family protein [bacterium]
MNKRGKITINLFFITVAVVFVVFGSITYSAKNRAPVVSNVHAEQRPGTEQAVITYDVYDADGDTLIILVQISDDDGQTFTVPAQTFSGDIGAGIRSGKNKRIVWDAGKDLTNLYEIDFSAKVTADDGKQSDEIIWQQDGAKMRLIPAGEFQMGSNNGDSDEKPVHTVNLDAFYMDKYEVTVGQYKKFIQATGHRAPNWSSVSQYSPTDNHPIIYVSWDDAQAYCKWAGKRLPTEAEWEKAARGGLVGKKYPWGDEAPDAGGKYRANFDPGNYTEDGYRYCAPVGSFPPNGYGLYNMAGNVWEWCSDWYDGNYYFSSPRNNPPGPASGSHRVLRGGSWRSASDGMRAAPRLNGVAYSMGRIIGFRSCVAQDVTP